MLNTRTCNYSDAYILVKGTATISGAGADTAARQLDKRNKQLPFKDCTLLTERISEINNILDNAKDLDVVVLMYNIIEYNNSYAKALGRLWQYLKDDSKIT